MLDFHHGWPLSELKLQVTCALKRLETKNSLAKHLVAMYSGCVAAQHCGFALRGSPSHALIALIKLMATCNMPRGQKPQAGTPDVPLNLFSCNFLHFEIGLATSESQEEGQGMWGSDPGENLLQDLVSAEDEGTSWLSPCSRITLQHPQIPSLPFSQPVVICGSVPQFSFLNRFPPPRLPTQRGSRMGLPQPHYVLGGTSLLYPFCAGTTSSGNTPN